MQITLDMNGLADLGQPLELAARGGFKFGDTAADDPSSDPSSFGSTVTDDVTPICGYTTTGVIETHLLPFASFCG